MALTREHLDSACTLVGTAPSVRAAAAEWRQLHPGIRMVVVDALDMRDETPARRLDGGSGAGRSLYLAATNGHCWHVTHEADEATAFIVTDDQG